MNWFYLDGGKEVGPLNSAEINELVQSGAIGSETLIRSEAGSQWKTVSALQAEARRRKELRQQQDQLHEQAPAQPRPAQEQQYLREQVEPSSSGSQAHGGTGGDKVACAECGGLFPEDEVVRFKDINVCAACKPRFVQKLREGAPIPTSMDYAGFWLRAGAKVIDTLILWAASFVITLVLGLVIPGTFATGMAQSPPEFTKAAIASIVLTMLLQLSIPTAYTTYFVGKFAATPGKMACGLKIVSPEGGKISYPRALGRYFAEIVSGLILGIGYIMAGFDEEKRALHDRICSTRVIKK